MKDFDQTCIDAFKNLNIIVKQDNSIQISPCCISYTHPVETIEFQKDPQLNQIRNTWNHGQFPKECSACQQAELSGVASRRQCSNQWYKDNGYNNTQVELLRIDYWTGDLCNLACVICGPQNSSAWKQELNWPKERKKTLVNQVWNTLDLTQLKFIHFNGGEPLLNKEHVKFLQAIPDKKQVHINYNTNGTVRPDNQLLDLWEQFKLVQLDFSIDDLGDRFDYQRYPAKWDQVASNLQWFIDHAPHNCMFATNTSVGILNHDNLDNLNQWLNTHFHTTHHNDPIEHRQQPVTGLFSLNDAKKRQEKILDFLENCDQRRGTNWKQVFPDLPDYLETDK
jgi:sulfatase maturation enzyme AslB (radical SAM superfamily)